MLSLRTPKSDTVCAAVKYFKLKVSLVCIAIGSFTMAFWPDQHNASLPTINCSKAFYDAQAPFLLQKNFQKNSQASCVAQFNRLYSNTSKTTLWLAEHKQPEQQFVSKPTLSKAQSTSIYPMGSLWQRNDVDQFNQIPFASKQHQNIWQNLDDVLNQLSQQQHADMYVVTGTDYQQATLSQTAEKIWMPAGLYKVMYLPSLGWSGAYYLKNDATLPAQVEHMSICALERKLQINLFPSLTDEQKREVYAWPMTQSVGKQPLNYGYWDTQGQCADAPLASAQRTLNQRFKPASEPSQWQQQWLQWSHDGMIWMIGWLKTHNF